MTLCPIAKEEGDACDDRLVTIGIGMDVELLIEVTGVVGLSDVIPAFPVSLSCTIGVVGRVDSSVSFFGACPTSGAAAFS